MNRLAAAALAALLLAARSGMADDDRIELHHTVALSVDYDSNVFDAFNHPRADFLGRLFYELQFGFRPTAAHLLSLDAQIGAKKYFAVSSQDALIDLLHLGYAYRGIPDALLGAEVEGKTRSVRDDRLDFWKVVGDLYAQRWFERQFRGRVQAEGTWFDAPRFSYLNYGYQRYGLALGKGFGSSVDLEVRYDFEDRLFPSRAFTNLGTHAAILLQESGRRRVDNLHEIGAELTVTRWLLARVAYAFQADRSTSYGESYTNHKLTVALSRTVIDPVALHLLFILQARKALDPVLIPATLQVEEDNENLSQLTAKVTWRLKDWVSLEAQYSRFWSQYLGENASFVKDVASLGTTFQF